MNNVLALLTLLLQYTDRISQISSLLQTAQSEGRDITDAELDQLFAEDDEARQRLQDLISGQ